ncbi:TetR/AcrR family transcriptional regulator [Mangrovihabitans endophyticus]|uniref:TetR/AcrR family transcriptional regulator n=1 Tax=Mangrovihabitans endophyticus TaxID=1751298 RepID=UPI00166784AE|nr:helix-turn-helix domain-containing protein [Mangrovihabitans endophyticus]
MSVGPEGLRVAKKRQARVAIRREALRLFLAQGFAATTVDQIARAANVSPRTLFRYFPTKQAIVLADSGGDQFAQAVRHQPAGLSRIEALRGAVHELFGAQSPDEQWEDLAQERLVTSTPELAAVALTQVRTNIDALTEALTDRAPTQPHTNRQLAGALVGLLLALDVPDQPTGTAFAARVDNALDVLRPSFPE